MVGSVHERSVGPNALLGVNGQTVIVKRSVCLERHVSKRFDLNTHALPEQSIHSLGVKGNQGIFWIVRGLYAKKYAMTINRRTAYLNARYCLGRKSHRDHHGLLSDPLTPFGSPMLFLCFR